MEELILYRGDYEKIKSFDFHKTHKTCYVGPGVYLTTSLRVANSYRTKGATGRDIKGNILFQGAAKDRNDAYNKAFEQAFVLEKYWKEHGSPEEGEYKYVKGKSIHRFHELSEKVQTTYKAKIRPLYNELVEQGIIKAEYESTMSYVKRTDGLRNLKVTYDRGVKVGYVTKFAFEKKPFEDSIIHIHRRIITDSTFWEIIYDKKIGFGEPADSRGEFIAKNTRPIVTSYNPYGSGYYGNRSIPSQSILASIRNATSQYGYLGFEYEGGSVIGGYGQHRAFCIWDDDYVNRHKVERIV